MGGHEHLPEGAALRSYLAALLAYGRIDPSSDAGELTARAAAGGPLSLSRAERAELALIVLGPYGRMECSCCGLPIPLSDTFRAWDDEFRCGWCAARDARRWPASTAASGVIFP